MKMNTQSDGYLQRGNDAVDRCVVSYGDTVADLLEERRGVGWNDVDPQASLRAALLHRLVVRRLHLVTEFTYLFYTLRLL